MSSFKFLCRSGWLPKMRLLSNQTKAMFWIGLPHVHQDSQQNDFLIGRIPHYGCDMSYFTIKVYENWRLFKMLYSNFILYKHLTQYIKSSTNLHFFFKSQESTDNKIGSYLSKKTKTINRELISQSRLEGTGIEMKELQTIPILFYNID